jgi:GntR family transcriptional regulator
VPPDLRPPWLEVDLPAITGRPKYLDVADDLRKKIAAGTYPVGAEVPSTSRLMEQYEVSVTVVRAAIRELRTEGLVLGQPGKGVYVQAEPAPETPSAEFTEVMDQLQALRELLDDFDTRLTRLEHATSSRGRASKSTRSGGREARRA